MPAGGARRIEGLDLLRGLAIALVLIRHSWPDFAGTAGVVGVVLFFTLSGYLITSLLTADITRFGRVRYGRFYRNRALRLLPALVLLVAGYAIVTLAWNPLNSNDNVLRAVVVSLTYTMDIPFDHGTIALSHLWTLAVEEQFYLIWPIVLAVAIRLQRVRLALIISSIGIVALLVTSYLVAQPDPVRIYTLPTSWCISMIIGAAASFAMPRLDGLLRGTRTTRYGSGLVALLSLLTIAMLPEAKQSLALYLVAGPLIAVATVVLITHLRTWQYSPLQILVPLRWLGTISYAAYLWNYLILSWQGPARPSSAQSIAVVALTLLAATLSWFAVERPMLNWKSRLDHRRSESTSAPNKVFTHGHG